MTDKSIADLFGLEEEEEEEDPIPKELAEHAAAEAKALRSAIIVALNELMAKEHVEIEEDNVEPVADELGLAAHEARTPRQALKKLRKALVDSELVEEVYADDRVLEAAFRRALGG